MQTILDLLAADGLQAIHVGQGEWHSPCPFCGTGTDRLSCWPDRRNSDGRYHGGRFVCRRCGQSGDAISYLMKRRNLSFRGACHELQIEPVGLPDRVQHKTKGWIPYPPKPAPGRSWSDRANAFLLSCIESLHANDAVLSWLQSERGLNQDTIERFQLGWNSQDRYGTRSEWGLPHEVKPDGKKKKVWMPAGLVIPWRDESGQVARLRIRRTVADSYGRYIVASSSSMTPMVQWGNQPVVAVVESELDLLLVSQECRDLIGIVAMGSAQARPDALLHKRLMTAHTLLVCLDNDDAGARESWGFWQRYPGFKRWPCIQGKDVCEQWRAGIPVRDWIMAALPER